MFKPTKRYRPERHFMRGPGPKWIEKHGGGTANTVDRHTGKNPITSSSPNSRESGAAPSGDPQLQPATRRGNSAGPAPEAAPNAALPSVGLSSGTDISQISNRITVTAEIRANVAPIIPDHPAILAQRRVVAWTRRSSWLLSISQSSTSPRVRLLPSSPVLKPTSVVQRPAPAWTSFTRTVAAPSASSSSRCSGVNVISGSHNTRYVASYSPSPNRRGFFF